MASYEQSPPRNLPNAHNRSISHGPPQGSNSSRGRQYSKSRGASMNSEQLIIKKLMNENKELRTQLRNLNVEMDNIISSYTAKKSGRRPESQREEVVGNELTMAQKALGTYETQHRKLAERVGALNDTSYRINLDKSIIQLKAEVRELEASNAKLIRFNKHREKVLDSVLDTGETPDMVYAYADLQSQVTLQARKLAEGENRHRQTLEMYTKLGEKEKEYRSAIEGYEAEGYSLKKPKHDPSEELTGKLNSEAYKNSRNLKELDNRIKRNEVKSIVLNKELKIQEVNREMNELKLKDLEASLAAYTRSIDEMNAKINNSVHRRNQSQPQAFPRLRQNEAVGESSTFITNQE